MYVAIASTSITQDSPKDFPHRTDPKAPHPRRFDRQTYNQISGLDARLLELIDFDSRQQAKKSPTGARYSLKPQAWLAKVLGVCRETVQNRIYHLEKLGILDVTRRDPKRGKWQTNMYKIVSFVWWRLRQALRDLRRPHKRAEKSPHLSTPMRGKETERREKGEPLAIKGILQDLFRRVRAGEKLV
jgi:hypothetical protein